MMTIISYFLSHAERDSSAFSKTEYYEMNETTHRGRQTHRTFERLRCGGENLSQATCLNFLVLFIMLTMACSSFT